MTDEKDAAEIEDSEPSTKLVRPVEDPQVDGRSEKSQALTLTGTETVEITPQDRAFAGDTVLIAGKTDGDVRGRTLRPQGQQFTNPSR